jgi:hypothetical protein
MSEKKIVSLRRSWRAAPAADDAIPAVGAPSPSPDAVVADLPFEPYHERNRVVLDLAPEGQTPFRLMLDTGAPNTLVLSGKAGRKLGIDVDGLREYGRVGTTVGPMDVRFHETESFRIAGFEFDTMPVLVAPKGWYNIAGPTDSVVGYDVLSQFLVRIDYERRRMWLKRTGDSRVTYLGADYALARRVGALVAPTQGGYAVWGLEPDGAAAAYGLRNGDVVVVPAGDDMISIEEVLTRIEGREELTVARREGDVWIDRILPETDPTADGPSGEPDSD